MSWVLIVLLVITDRVWLPILGVICGMIVMGIVAIIVTIFDV